VLSDPGQVSTCVDLAVRRFSSSFIGSSLPSLSSYGRCHLRRGPGHAVTGYRSYLFSCCCSAFHSSIVKVPVWSKP